MSETIELDFSDVKEFAAWAKDVPKGNYLLKVVAVEAKQSSNSNPMWVVDSEFVDGAYAGERIREHLTLTEKALFKVKSWLDAIHGQNLPKSKIKLPNTTAELQKRFVGKVYGAHVADGDPYVNGNGETVTKSEIKYHLFAKEVAGQKAAPSAEQVTASTPESAPTAEPVAADEPETPSGDVADQLESFDLDNL